MPLIGEVQSPTVSIPLTVCPTVMGVTANAGHVIGWATKLTTAGASKVSVDVGMKR